MLQFSGLLRQEKLLRWFEQNSTSIRRLRIAHTATTSCHKVSDLLITPACRVRESQDRFIPPKGTPNFTILHLITSCAKSHSQKHARIVTQRVPSGARAICGHQAADCPFFSSCPFRLTPQSPNVAPTGKLRQRGKHLAKLGRQIFSIDIKWCFKTPHVLRRNGQLHFLCAFDSVLAQKQSNRPLSGSSGDNPLAIHGRLVLP